MAPRAAMRAMARVSLFMGVFLYAFVFRLVIPERRSV
jgi:hypothetical protein